MEQFPTTHCRFFQQGGRNITERTDTWVTVGANFRPLEGLEIDASYTYNADNDLRRDHTKEVTRWWGPNDFRSNNSTPTGILYRSGTDTYQAVNAFVAYTKQFGDHYFKAQVGYQQEERDFLDVQSSINNLLTDNLPSASLADGDPNVSDFINGWSLRGGFYRVNYAFKDKYLLEASGRYDGSSRFPEGNRFVFNPSASVGWVVSKENFFEPLKSTVNFLKLRASYGSLGNQRVNGFQPYLANLSLNQAGFIIGGSRPFRAQTPGLVSTDITWETVESQNFGVDVNMFNSKLTMSFDYFIRDAKDQLQPATLLPSALGVTPPNVNAADTRTKGWEFEISYRNSERAFKYNAGLNLSRARGVVTKYDDPSGSIGNTSLNLGFSRLYEGMEIGEIWGFETRGLFQSQEEVDQAGLDYSAITTRNIPIAAGDVWYVDQNGDGAINRGTQSLDDPGDLVKIGNSTPDLSFGINLGAEYKNFYIDIFMQGVLGREFFFGRRTGNGALYWPAHGGGASTVQGTPEAHQLDYWTPDNTDAFWPRYLGNWGFHNFEYSDRYLPNLSYLRMKQLTVGFKFPQELIRKIGLQKAQLYITGQNLFEFDDLPDGYDPEINRNTTFGFEAGKAYPFLRSISIGANITL